MTRTHMPPTPGRRRSALLWPALTAALALTLSGQGATDMNNLQTARPADNGAELRNPGMGWVLHYYDNVPTNYGSRLAPADRLADWPGLALVYLRIPWSYVEPAEGVFNWSVLDTPMQRYRDAGLRACFRLSCSESWMEYATPKWVEQAGAKGYRFRQGKIEGNGPFWEPDYDDPVFLDKLDRFLAALAARYDGHPDVAYVDIGSFGVWGEGHTWASTGKAYPTTTITRHIDLHRKHFKQTPLITMDDFLSRPGTFVPLRTGEQTRSFDLVLPVAWRGREFRVRTGLWQPGVKEHAGRLRPAAGENDRTVWVGTLGLGPAGEVTFTPSPPTADSATGAAGADFAVLEAGIRHDPANQPHSLKIDVRLALPAPVGEGVHPFVHLVDATTGQEVFAPHEEREDDALTRSMAEAGLGLRDDSILVQGPPAAYFHALMAQSFWRRAIVTLESEHYGGSAQRGCWQDGSAFLQSVEDYHASYVSIHWWPHEFLAANRDLVRRINLRLGYRFQLAEFAWPRTLGIGQEWPVAWSWRNAGVAPPYQDLFPAVTLRDAKGGIAAVFADDTLNLRQLPVSVPGPAAPQPGARSFRVPFQLGAGRYDVFVSVGDRRGHPLVALPLDGDDGQRRYRLGSVDLTGDVGLRLEEARVDGDRLAVRVRVTPHGELPATAVPFVHLEANGKLLVAGGSERQGEAVQGGQPGEYVATAALPLSEVKAGQSVDLLAGLWCPDRLGKPDERLRPDGDQGDRRVRLGTVTRDAAGQPAFTPDTP